MWNISLIVVMVVLILLISFSKITARAINLSK